MKHVDTPPPLLVIVYVSSASPTLDPGELAVLVRRARAYNEAHEITGVLLHHDGSFMQALEGPADAVSSLFERIQRDRRHQGIIELCREPAEQREFPFWSLVSAPDARALGLTVGTTGLRASDGSVQRHWQDGIATGFLRSFCGPRDYLSGPLQ